MAVLRMSRGCVGMLKLSRSGADSRVVPEQAGRWRTCAGGRSVSRRSKGQGSGQGKGRLRREREAEGRSPEDGTRLPRWKQWLRRPGAWTLALGVPALLLVLGLAMGFGQQVGTEAVDVPAVKDQVRSMGADPEDVRLTVVSVDELGPLEVVTPAGVRLSQRHRRFLKSWSYTNMQPGGVFLSDVHRELMARGAASLDNQLVTIKLEGRRNQKIFIDDIRPVEVKRGKPYSGTLVSFPDQSGGSTEKMILDFDDALPVARVSEDRIEGSPVRPGGQFFRNRTLTLTDGAEEVIVIRSITSKWSVTFRLRIDYRIGGQRRHLIRDNGGLPFALSARNCTRLGRLGKDGPIAPGQVAYQDVWEQTERVQQATNPAAHPALSPYCLPRRAPSAR